MTASGLAAASVLLVGVFALFWWLVELTGGLASDAVSVARSMQTGVLAWVDAQLEGSLEAAAVDGESSNPDSTGSAGSARFLDEGFEVPIQAVSRGHR
jgi:hypothetical protein